MDRRIKKERLLNKIIKNPFTYIFLLFLVFLFSYSAIATYKKSKIAKFKTRQVESELKDLIKQEADLKNSLNDMNTSFGVEKSLREKFGIIKEGEKAVIIVEEPVEEPLKPEKDKKNIFGLIKGIF